jgi:four helix bundle protein
MTASQTFKGLIVWQKAHKLVLDIYKLSDNFPQREIYSLTSQLRRAAISIPANMPKVIKRKVPQTKRVFMNIAQGSLEEVPYYLILAQDLDYAKTDELSEQLDEVGRLLYAYSKAIAEHI